MNRILNFLVEKGRRGKLIDIVIRSAFGDWTRQRGIFRLWKRMFISVSLLCSTYMLWLSEEIFESVTYRLINFIKRLLSACPFSNMPQATPQARDPERVSRKGRKVIPVS